MTKKSFEAIPALASIGVDIGKDVFHVVAFDVGGNIVLRRKIKRLALESEFKKLAPSVVGLEACHRPGQQACPHRLERSAKRERVRYPPRD